MESYIEPDRHMTVEEKRIRNRDKMRLWRERNKDRVPTPEQRAAHNERNRTYRERHPDRIQRIATESNAKRKQEKTTWARENYRSLSIGKKEIVRAKARMRTGQWAAENREASRARSRKYYYDNQDLVAAKSKTPEARARVAAYMQQRKRANPEFRLKCNLRVRLRSALKRQRGTTSLRTVQLIGCSVSFLVNHLERLFQSGMSWANYGQWHVDHIQPCAKFNLLDPDQQKACFHYSNLQPLWAVDNLRKSAKTI